MLPANFNRLYYFWTVGKAGTISAAAERLLLSQSTISLQMQQLEKELGKQLFTRGRHGVVLTAAGRLAFDSCERIFSHAEGMLSALREGGEPASAPFRLGVSQSVPRDKVLAVLSSVRAATPGARVTILSRSSEELASRLERRMLDAVLSDIDLSVSLGKECRSSLLSSTQLFFAATPELKGKAGAFPGCLARVPLLLRAPENPVRKEVDAFLARRRLAPVIAGELESPDLIRVLALRGEGAAVMDPESIREDLRLRRLVLLHARPIGIREGAWLSALSRGNAPEAAAVIDALL